MRRGTIFVLLFLLVVGGVLAANFFFRSQPPLEISLSVSPLIEDWVTAAVARFNESGVTAPNSARRVVMTVSTVDDLQVWGDTNRQWSATSHPDAWIPAAFESVGYATEGGIPLEMIQRTTARTILMWGGFGSSVETITNAGADAFDWDAVAAASNTVRLALPHPSRSMAGLAMLVSAAGAFNETTIPGSAQLGQTFRDWAAPILLAVPNYNTLGGSIAETMAARGMSVGEIALLTENQWLLNLRGQFVTSADALRLAYPAYNVALTFPLALYTPNPQTEPNAADIRAGVTAFGDFLISEQAQSLTGTYGLRSLGSAPDETSNVFSAGLPYGALYEPGLDNLISLPPRTELLRLMTWANSVIRQ